MAQELISGNYQPSGIDYIIHVLGDKERESYIESFREGNFKYAATIKETYDEWEFWVKRANWFFYRELYENWHPVYGNEYEIYWERNEEDENHKVTSGFQIGIRDVDDSTKVLYIQCDEPINGTADVFIDYAVKSRGNTSSKFNILKMLKVANTGVLHGLMGYYCEANYLRAESAEYTAVSISNGYGEVTLTSLPKESAYLEVYGYSCDTIYTVASDYAEVIGVVPNEAGTMVMVESSARSREAVGNITAIDVDGVQYDVLAVNYYDGYIGIDVAGPVSVTANSMIELLRE